MSSPRALVVMPTYNEIENVVRVVGAVRETGNDVLIVDDNSPDGTGLRADTMAAADPGITVLHRAGKLGLGTAYLAGFAIGLERGYDLLVEMDMDGSHRPEHLPAIIAAAVEVGGMGLGSRYVAGGSVIGWGFDRQLLSRGANLYCRVLLWCGVNDITSGFRAYTRDLLQAIDLDRVFSEGYSFQIEMVYRTLKRGFRVREVPIQFEDRILGASKVSRAEINKALLTVVKLRFRGRRSL